LCSFVSVINNSSHFNKHLRRSTRPHNKSPPSHASKDTLKLIGTAHHVMAIGDSGSTHNLIRASHAMHLSDVSPCSDLRVTLPNGAAITSTHKGTLAVSATLNTTAYVFTDHDLQQSLLSLSTLCMSFVSLRLSFVMEHSYGCLGLLIFFKQFNINTSVARIVSCFLYCSLLNNLVYVLKRFEINRLTLFFLVRQFILRCGTLIPTGTIL